MSDKVEPQPQQSTGQREASKSSIRKDIWDFIEDQDGLARFPLPLHGHIPNFSGAEDVCDKLTTFKPFENAKVIAMNPDRPQQQARYLALEASKCLYVPIPHMYTRRKDGAFKKISPPEDADEKLLRLCSTRKGSKFHGEEIAPEDMQKVDLVIIGSVAVSPKGYRIANGSGYGDLEYAMLRAMNVIDDTTPVITLVHDSQITDIPAHLMKEHDVPVDYIITNTREIRCDPHPKPSGIIWSMISERKMSRIPCLSKLQEMDSSAGRNTTLKVSNEEDKDSDDERQEYLHQGQPVYRGRGGRRRGRGRPYYRRFQGRRRERNSEADMNGDQHSDGELGPDEHGDRGDSRPRRGGYFRGRGRGRGGYRGYSRGGYRGYRYNRNSERDQDQEDSHPGKNHEENGEREEHREKGMRKGGRRQDSRERDDSREMRRGGRRGRGRGRGGRGRSDRDGREPQEQLPALYVGNLPNNLRCSEFKSMVRDRGVNPLRFIWQGSAHYSLLLFEQENLLNDMLNSLQGMTINDQELKVEVSINTRDKGKKIMDGSDGDGENAQAEEQATTL